PCREREAGQKKNGDCPPKIVNPSPWRRVRLFVARSAVIHLNGNNRIRWFQAGCAVSNDDPHPQVRDAFGFAMWKPTPVKPSRKSKVAPRKCGALSASI